jgi:hypothetical protein
MTGKQHALARLAQAQLPSTRPSRIRTMRSTLAASFASCVTMTVVMSIAR